MNIIGVEKNHIGSLSEKTVTPIGTGRRPSTKYAANQLGLYVHESGRRSLEEIVMVDKPLSYSGNDKSRKTIRNYF